MLKIRVITVTKKVIKQLDKTYSVSKQMFEDIKSGKLKILGKFSQDMIEWRTGHAYILIVQNEDSCILIPYFQMIKNIYPDIPTIVLL